MPARRPDPHKQELREALLDRRRALSPQQLAVVSTRLTEVIVSHRAWIESPALAAFVGVRGEVDTTPLLQRSLAAGKRLWLPRVLGGGRMRFWPCEDLDRLEAGRMGLREPPKIGEGVVMPGPELGVELILVPGLGFGRDGARIGFGAGHYDRALGLRADDPALTMPALWGVCPAAFLDPPGGAIPMHGHDRRMDAIATELGVEPVG